MQNFVLRTTFTIPEDWDQTQPTALHLPLGEAGDFSHPEALAYIDGLLEENESELSVKHDSISLNLRPYQIMRLRLKPK